MPKPCACGCGDEMHGGDFLPGHDQKLRVAIEAKAGGLLALKQLVEDELKCRVTVPGAAKIFPECGHRFQGNGWDGIDAHWCSKHEHVHSYSEAWPLIQSGNYQKRKKGRRD